MEQAVPYSANDVLTHGSNFRVHGNGFIQIDMPNNDRVHVWGHGDIPHQATSTQIHDHKFSFESLVMYGTLVNLVYEVDTDGKLHRQSSLKFDVYRATPRDREDTELTYTHTVVIRPSYEEVMRTGDRYGLRRFMLHETFVNCPTITVMRKYDVASGYVPMVLCPFGLKPDNDFNRYSATDERKLRNITEDVFRYWGDDSYRESVVSDIAHS